METIDELACWVGVEPMTDDEIDGFRQAHPELAGYLDGVVDTAEKVGEV